MVRKLSEKYEKKLFVSIRIILKMYSLNYILFTAPSEEKVKLAIEHIYPLVLPFGRNKILDDKCFLGVTGEINYHEQNTRIIAIH